MRRDDWWRLQYHARRYMQHLGEEELQQRVHDVFRNMVVLSRENKIGFVRHQDNEDAIIRWADVVEEFRIRFGPFPAGFDRYPGRPVRIPRPDHQLARKAVRAVNEFRAEHHVDPGECLVKYGNAERIRRLYEEGELRVAPASSYDDPSLNPAIEDKELERYIQPLPHELDDAIRRSNNPAVQCLLGARGERITIQGETDYYVACFSRVLDPALFLDFDYDACLVITDARRFARALADAFFSHRRGWRLLGVPIRYVDPLTPTGIEDAFAVWQYKHFRFAYQQEYRLVGLPPSRRGRIDERLVLRVPEMGSYATIIDLTHQ